ncbi:MAG: hypothetical protein R3C11_08270 [Planctomycetaceae bacterium]
MFDLMYELPDQDAGRTYVITPEIIRGEDKLFPGTTQPLPDHALQPQLIKKRPVAEIAAGRFSMAILPGSSRPLKKVRIRLNS